MLIRDMFSKDLIFTTNSIKQFNKSINYFKKKFEEYCTIKHIHEPDIREILESILKETKDGFANENVKIHEKLTELKNKIEDKVPSMINLVESVGIGIQKIYDEVGLKDIGPSIDSTDFTKIYIPILRGLRNIDISNENQYTDFYANRTIQDYFHNTDAIKAGTFTGLKAYDKIKELLLGGHNQRKLIKDYEKYLSKTFFENKPVALIPSETKKTIVVKIDKEIERPICKLGDGIQSIIIMTMPLFLNKGKNILVFIEEPEQLLHPGLQRKLIETLLHEKGFEKFQYYITTHSNHFLDTTFDFSKISIYSLRKKIPDDGNEEEIAKFSIENLSGGDKSSLELLGVRNSSVFLSNCTIWVEGITDRMYFKHYLELYMKENANGNKIFKEDFHYSFVEYSGNNITHWSFLEDGDKNENVINVESLCGRVFLIADKDDNKKLKRHELLKKKLGERFYLLDCREVENLITKEVLMNVIREYEGGESDMADFKEEDYRDESLGKFIEDKLSNNKKRKGMYASESGAITDKVVFCKKAIGHIKKYEDMSKEAQDICVKIYKFIENNDK